MLLELASQVIDVGLELPWELLGELPDEIRDGTGGGRGGVRRSGVVGVGGSRRVDANLETEGGSRTRGLSGAPHRLVHIGVGVDSHEVLVLVTPEDGVGGAHVELEELGDGVPEMGDSETI